MATMAAYEGDELAGFKSGRNPFGYASSANPKIQLAETGTFETSTVSEKRIIAFTGAGGYLRFTRLNVQDGDHSFSMIPKSSWFIEVDLVEVVKPGHVRIGFRNLLVEREWARLDQKEILLRNFAVHKTRNARFLDGCFLMNLTFDNALWDGVKTAETEHVTDFATAYSLTYKIVAEAIHAAKVPGRPLPPIPTVAAARPTSAGQPGAAPPGLGPPPSTPPPAPPHQQKLTLLQELVRCLTRLSARLVPAGWDNPADVPQMVEKLETHWFACFQDLCDLSKIRDYNHSHTPDQFLEYQAPAAWRADRWQPGKLRLVYQVPPMLGKSSTLISFSNPHYYHGRHVAAKKPNENTYTW